MISSAVARVILLREVRQRFEAALTERCPRCGSVELEHGGPDSRRCETCEHQWFPSELRS